MLGHYVLDGHKAILCPDPMMWAKWYETADRRVAHTAITEDIYVSTVFLGLDHSYFAGSPVLFESMVFGGEQDGDCQRYHTWDEAEAGHEKLCDELRKTG